MASDWRSHPDELSLTQIWAATGILTAVLILGFRPFEALSQAIDHGGATDEMIMTMIIVAELTVPLVVAASILTILTLRGVLSKMHGPNMAFVVSAILIAAAVSSRAMLIGLPVNFGTLRHGHPFGVLMWAVEGYITSYGAPLAISAVLIGVASALTFQKWGWLGTQERIAHEPISLLVDPTRPAGSHDATNIREPNKM